MTLYDLIMSCDNVMGTVEVDVYSSGNTIAPIKTFKLVDYLNDEDFYELSKHLEVTHFEFEDMEHINIWVYTLDCPLI